MLSTENEIEIQILLNDLIIIAIPLQSIGYIYVRSSNVATLEVPKWSMHDYTQAICVLKGYPLSDWYSILIDLPWQAFSTLKIAVKVIITLLSIAKHQTIDITIP